MLDNPEGHYRVAHEFVDIGPVTMNGIRLNLHEVACYFSCFCGHQRFYFFAEPSQVRKPQKSMFFDEFVRLSYDGSTHLT